MLGFDPGLVLKTENDGFSVIGFTI